MNKMLVSLCGAALLTVALTTHAPAQSAQSLRLHSSLVCDLDGNEPLTHSPGVGGFIQLDADGDLHIKASGLPPNSEWGCFLTCFGSVSGTGVDQCGTADASGKLNILIPGFAKPAFGAGVCFGDIIFDLAGSRGGICRPGFGRPQ